MDDERPQCNADDTWTCDALGRVDEAAVMRRVQDDPAFLRSRDDSGQTPLQRAIDSNLPGLVEYMLRHGADANASTDDGYTCLLQAIESDDPASLQIVSQLIDAGAALRGTESRVHAPLHMAAGRGLVEKARLLLDAGAQVNQREDFDDNDTPLIVAARGGFVEVVRLLFQRGADPTMRDTITDRTPLEIAAYGVDTPDPYDDVLSKCMDEAPSMWKSMNVAPEHIEVMKSQLIEMARKYAEKRARDVDHRQVVQILAEHEGRRISGGA